MLFILLVQLLHTHTYMRVCVWICIDWMASLSLSVFFLPPTPLVLNVIHLAIQHKNSRNTSFFFNPYSYMEHTSSRCILISINQLFARSRTESNKKIFFYQRPNFSHLSCPEILLPTNPKKKYKNAVSYFYKNYLFR